VKHRYCLRCCAEYPHSRSSPAISSPSISFIPVPVLNGVLTQLLSSYVQSVCRAHVSTSRCPPGGASPERPRTISPRNTSPRPLVPRGRCTPTLTSVPPPGSSYASACCLRIPRSDTFAKQHTHRKTEKHNNFCLNNCAGCAKPHEVAKQDSNVDSRRDA
jgi:hypothetical protein